MTEADILDGVILREGGFVNDSADKGGPTKYGITAVTLGNWRGLPRAATAEEVADLRQPEARDIYRIKYVAEPGFTPEHLPYEPLRVQMIDFGINSGPTRALRWLQRVLGVPATGLWDIATVERLQPTMATRYFTLVNDALCAARLYMIDSATDAGTVSKKFEEGIESRALSFFLAKP